MKRGTWVLLKITETKPTPTNDAKTTVYYEMCNFSGKKVAGAITIPIASNTSMPDFKTVILSTLEPHEVTELLQEPS